MQRIQGYINTWNPTTNTGSLKKSSTISGSSNSSSYTFTREDVEKYDQVEQYLQPAELFSFEDGGDGHAIKLRYDVDADEDAYSAPLSLANANRTADLMNGASSKGSLFGGAH